VQRVEALRCAGPGDTPHLGKIFAGAIGMRQALRFIIVVIAACLAHGEWWHLMARIKNPDSNMINFDNRIIDIDVAHNACACFILPLQA
jgi:hypothetical protein